MNEEDGWIKEFAVSIFMVVIMSGAWQVMVYIYGIG